MRPLSAGERMMWRADRISPLNFVLAVQMEQPLPVHQLKKALIDLVRVRPVLGLSVSHDSDEVLRFVPAKQSPYVHSCPQMEWLEVCQNQLNLPLITQVHIYVECQYRI